MKQQLNFLNTKITRTIIHEKMKEDGKKEREEEPKEEGGDKKRFLFLLKRQKAKAKKVKSVTENVSISRKPFRTYVIKLHVGF